MTPDQLLTTFRTNIVRVGNPKARTDGLVDHVTLTPEPAFTGTVGRWGSGVSCGVMTLDVADPGDAGAFPAWICNYDLDQVNYTTLTNTRDFCFTANMDGCTFGIGSQVGGGVVTVSHANANALGGGDLDKQASEQRLLSAEAIPSGARLLEPSTYGFSKETMMTPLRVGYARLRITTFGVLQGDVWEFYYQQYL